MVIKTKRIYEPFATADGYRVLVDRLWPRGIKKETAHINEWLKEAAPSTGLRKWFNHEPEKWPEFLKKYEAELEGSDVLTILHSLAKEHKTITLLYAAKEEQHNQAAALLQFLKSR